MPVGMVVHHQHCRLDGFARASRRHDHRHAHRCCLAHAQTIQDHEERSRASTSTSTFKGRCRRCPVKSGQVCNVATTGIAGSGDLDAVRRQATTTRALELLLDRLR